MEGENVQVQSGDNQNVIECNPAKDSTRGAGDSVDDSNNQVQVQSCDNQNVIECNPAEDSTRGAGDGVDGSNIQINSGASTSNSSFEVQDVDKTADSGDVSSNALCNLLVYTSGDSSSSSSEEEEEVEVGERSDDSDSYDCESDTPEVEKNVTNRRRKKKNGDLSDTLKSMGELCIDDLPPVPDLSKLNLNVKKEDCDEIGKISSIIDKLVMVESIADKPAYDIDTLLFLDNGKQPLGYIFDVIGAVTCPMYAIRFNSKEEIASLNITKGLPVFSAPKTQHSQYVFVHQLLKSKGTDASWKDDLEVPQEFQDFSDDEAEVSSRTPNPDSRKRNSIERYKNFEKDMNVKNLIDSRLHKIRDNFEPAMKKQTPTTNSGGKRGFQFQPNYRPNFGFSQGNTSSTPCAFPPPFGMPTFLPSNMPVPTFGPQSIPPFIPSLPPPPPNFIPGLPATLPSMPFPPLQPNISYPPPDMVNPIFPNLQMVPPPSASQGKTPQMLFPPRPPSQNPSFVPNMPFMDPRVPMWHNFSTPPPNMRQFPTPRNYYPKRQ